MADNVTLPIPATSGKVVASDEIAGVNFQRVKLTLGADGQNDGDVSSANPVPVAGPVTVSGVSTAAGQASALAVLELLATEAKLEAVRLILAASQGLLAGGLPAALGTAGGLKSSLVDLGGAATDAVLQAVRDRLPAAFGAGGGVKIDGSGVALPVSGTVVATGAASAALATQATLAAVLAALPASLGQALAAACLPVVLPVAQDVVAYAGAGGAIKVADGGGSLTVDAPVGTPVFVRLSDGSAAIATLPVSLASLPSLAAGTANIGKVDQGAAGAAEWPVSLGSSTLTYHTGTVTSGAGGSVKASPGRVFHLEIDNATGGTVVVNLYNTATPSVGDAYVSVQAATGNSATRDLGARGTNFDSVIYYIVTSAVRSVTPIAGTAVSITISYE